MAGNRGTFVRGVQKTNARGQADTGNGTDGIYAQAGARVLLSMKRKGARVSDGYTGSLLIGVDPT